MRVLVLSQYYTPEPMPKPAQVAHELAKRGHDVTVLTGIPNYPTGRIYPGHRLRPISRQSVDGIPVTRVFEIPYHGHSALGRLANYGSFATSAALIASLRASADVCYVWHPPLTVALPAIWQRALRGVPFVYDVQDVWPESIIESGLMRPGRATAVLSMLERYAYRAATFVTVPTDGARANLLAKGVSDGKIVVLPHWVLDSQLAEVADESVVAARNLLGAEKEFVVTYAGNIGVVQDLGVLVDVAEDLASRTNIAIRLIGAGSSRNNVECSITRRALQNIRVLDPVPEGQILPVLKASDVLFVQLRSSLGEWAVPTKLMAYLAAGRPIVAALSGAGARLVERSQAGVVVEPGNRAAIARAIVTLHEAPEAQRATMGQVGREFIRSTHAFERVFDQLETLLMAAARRA